MADLRDRLRSRFRWRGDRTDDGFRADPTGWWRDAETLRELGPALANLFPDELPTVVLAPQSRGLLIGALVAAHLRVGLVEMRKDPGRAAWVGAAVIVDGIETPAHRRQLGLRALLHIRDL